MAVEQSHPLSRVSPALIEWLITDDRRCPCCGRRFAFRVPARLNDAMNLTTHYRCGRAGRYVYVHTINLGWG